MRTRRLSSTPAMRRIAPALTLAAACAALQSLPFRASAATDNWTDGTGYWSVAANWTTPPSTHAVPVAGDTVNIVETDGISRTITYDYTGAAATLGYLTISLTGSSGGNTTLSMAANNLTSNYEYIADSGGGSNATGYLLQNGGNNSVASALYMGYNGTDSGFYTLSAGSLSLNSSAGEYLGLSGKATFVQSGGAHTINANGYLNMGWYIGSSANYTLSGGSLDCYGYEQIGVSGNATFTQSGGSNDIFSGSSYPNLYLGGNSNSVGTYNLGAGNLYVAGVEYVGNGATGIISQTGGTNTVGSLYLGNSSTAHGNYSLSGTGSLTSNGAEYIGNAGVGAFSQSGGTHNVTNSGYLYLGYSSGSSGSYSLSAGNLNVTSGDEVLGYSGHASFIQTGGTNSISGVLMLAENAGSSASYSLGGTGSIAVGNNEYIGSSGSATFNQTGGSNIVSGVIWIGSGSTFNLSGGSAQTVNVNNSGNVTISGGAVLNTSLFSILADTANSTLNNGTINTTQLRFYGNLAQFHWIAGTVNITADTTWDSAASTSTAGSAFGSSLALGANQTLMISANETLGGTGPFALTLNTGSSHYVSGALTLPSTGSLTQNPGSSLYYNTLTQAGGTINGTLTNKSSFIYQSGKFNGRLVNQGSISLGPTFTAGNGIENDASMTLQPGQTVTANGSGFYNLGTFNLNSATLAGSNLTNGPAAPFNGPGTIAASFTNLGVLNPNGYLAVQGNAINQGTIRGNGALSFSGSFTNDYSGIIDLPNTNSLTVSAPWSNNGLISLDGTNALLGGGTITNNGTLQGVGTLSASFDNRGIIRPSGGQLTLTAANVQAEAGSQIQISTGNTLFLTSGLSGPNNGTIALSGGAFDTSNNPLVNAGTISGSGILRTGNLTNSGATSVILLADAPSSIYGPVNNSPGANIKLVNATTTFYGPVNNNGTIKVTSGTARFLGNGVSLTVGGTYTSDPADNYFDGLTITSTGTVSGGPGDRFFLNPGGTFTNNGHFINGGTLQTAENVINAGTFSQTGPQSWSTGTTFTNNAGSATFQSNAKLYGLSITAGTVDLTTSQFIVETTDATKSATLASLQADIANHALFSSTLIPSTALVLADNAITQFSSYAGSPTDNNSLLVTTALRGDANLDNIVNADDLQILMHHFGQPTTDWTAGNFTGDPTIDLSDLSWVLNNMNLTYNPATGAISSSSTPVPEPASLTLLLAATPLLLRRRGMRA